MQRLTTPPFDPWAWMQASQETWWAGMDPRGIGRHMRDQRLARLIAHTMRESPLYHRRQPDAQRLQDCRPVTKAELMRHFDDWATDRRITHAAVRAWTANPGHVADAFLGDYLVWTSSGTSGEPGLFVQDAQSLAAYDAIDSLRLRGTGLLPSSLGLWGAGQRFAFVGATGGHFAGCVNMERLRRIVPAGLAPDIHLLSVLEPMDRIATALQALRPSVLITYPSCAAALARMQQDGNLYLQLQEIWLGGEHLSQTQRSVLQQAFACRVRNNYGASEFFSIACECSHGHLHLNEDWLVLEPVDQDMQPVPPGQLSHAALLTNLANLTQPLIRYVLTDQIRMHHDRCPCGSGFATLTVEGRADDTVLLHDAHHRDVTILPLALETALEEGAHVTLFQVLCHADRSLELRFEGTVRDAPAAFARARRVLSAFLIRHGVVGTGIIYSALAPQRQPGASGKLKRVLNVRDVEHA
jgi:phenylacetate-CoA ligase